MKIEPQCMQYADTYDAEHIKRQERTSLGGTKEHTVRIVNQIRKQQFFEESKSSLYGPRIAD